jgi:photosystem II stability/assembly factor-like uncharacterized protein
MVEAPGDEGGLYRSTDSGASWTLVNNSGGIRQRPFYFHYVDVNPKDENDLWIGAVSQYRSTDGGKTVFTSADAARRQPRHLVQPRQP